MTTDAHKAIQAAKNAALEYYQEPGIEDIRLEEVELAEDEDIWRVTLSFRFRDLVPVHKVGTEDEFEEFLRESRYKDREYKIFEIWSNTGEVRSMKIREL